MRGQSLLGPFHLDLKTAFLQGEHYNLSSRSVVVQLPPDIGLPTWMVGLCLRPVYGLNDAPRRWWNRLDKFLHSVGMEPTRADRCTYVAYEGIGGKKDKSCLAPGSFSQEKEPEQGSTPQEVEPTYLKELACHAISCYAYDEGNHSSSDRAEERSYLSCPDIAQCFNTDSTKKMVDHAWRPVTDSKLLGFLGSVACKKRGWFPYENGHALVSHRAKALRTPAPVHQVKDYPYRVSMILRQGTWWIIERAHDLRLDKDGKTCFLEEEAEVLVSLFLPEKASYKVESLSELSPELVDQLLEHFVDPVHGSPSKGRKTVGVMSLHVDDLIISGTHLSSLPGFLRKSGNTSLSVMRTRMTLRSPDSVFVGFLMHRVTRSTVFPSWRRLSYPSILRMLMCVIRLCILPIVPCLAASIGFSRELNFKGVISSLVWPPHPQHQPSVTAKS